MRDKVVQRSQTKLRILERDKNVRAKDELSRFLKLRFIETYLWPIFKISIIITASLLYAYYRYKYEI